VSIRTHKRRSFPAGTICDLPGWVRTTSGIFATVGWSLVSLKLGPESPTPSLPAASGEAVAAEAAGAVESTAAGGRERRRQRNGLEGSLASRQGRRDDVMEFLGEDARVITNPQGDTILLSKSGLKRVRFDINNPSQHVNPHAHVEIKVGNRWIKSGPLYPSDVAPK